MPMSRPTDGTRSALHRELGLLRREAGESSPLAFARTYLPAHFRLEPSPMHEELFELLAHATLIRGARLAIAAPRGHAKSTIVGLAYILWSICYGREPFIVLVSNTLDQASDSLSHVKEELQHNPRLLEDFSEACEPLGSTPAAPRWRREEIITRNGVKVTALGSENKIRGRRHHEHRPTLIVLDDIENESEVRSCEQRRHKELWFHKAVLKSGTDRTNVVLLGTLLHYDSLLAKLIDPKLSPGWTGRKYRAVLSWSSRPELWARWESIYGHGEQHEGRSGPKAAEAYLRDHREEMLEGTEVLWPQLEDYPRLMELQLTEGRLSFLSEKQNEPVNPESCDFEPAYFEGVLVAGWPAHLDLKVVAIDPSKGRDARPGDYSARIKLGRDPRDGLLYVEADLARRPPRQIVDDAIDLWLSWRPDALGLESDAFQSLFLDIFGLVTDERKVTMAVTSLSTEGVPKPVRIRRLDPYLARRMLRFVDGPGTRLLLDQLRYFPQADHDDGPDALELALRLGLMVLNGRHTEIETDELL